MGDYTDSVQQRSEVWIVIPAFNEAAVIGSVVVATRRHGYNNIIVVDDGSSDVTAARAQQAGAMTLSHRINRGKGAATKTGLEAAKILGAKIIVTLDGDGQHDPADIPHLIAPLLAGRADVALGTRQLITSHMPRHKVVSNRIANMIAWSFSGLWVADSQSGFRAYSRQAADLINTRADHYNYETETIREIREYRLRYAEVPISVKYTAYSMSKPYRQSLSNGLRTVYKMLWNTLSF